MASVPNVVSSASSTPQAPRVQQYEPGSLGRRFVAVMVDGMVTSVIRLPFSFGVGVMTGLNAITNPAAAAKKGADPVMFAVTIVIGLIVTYFYTGWFNKNKGATPGKLLMGLRVSRADDGTRLTYLRSFCREISKFTLVIGVFFAIFRKDKRALHDLMCNTKVIHQKSG